MKIFYEEKYGLQYRIHIFCGETIAGEELYTSEVEEYLYKINEAVGEETAIGVLVTDSVYSHQLLDYFVNMKKEKDFRIHVFMDTEIPVREGNERLMLTYLEHIKELDSVAFFNRAGIEMMNLHEMSYSPARTYRRTGDSHAGGDE